MSEASAEDMSQVAPDTPISKLLGGSLARHAALLKELGYDEVHEFCNIPAAELSSLLQTLKERGVPPGHLGKIQRKLEALRSEVWELPTPSLPESAPPEADAAAQSATEAAVPPVPKTSQPTVATATSPSEPAESSVGLAAFPLARTFLKLVDVDGHRRSFFGRDDPTMKLNNWQCCMNKHVLALVRSKPELLRKSGKEWKLGAYHQEAAALVNSDRDFHYVKPSGSRGANRTSSTTPSSSAEPEASGTKKRSSQRQGVMTPDERTLRLAELPALITNKREEVRYHTLHMPRTQHASRLSEHSIHTS